MEQNVIEEKTTGARQTRWRDCIVLLAAVCLGLFCWFGASVEKPVCTAQNAGAKLEFQTATLSELKTVAGIGVKTAEKIVAARSAKGVASIEECYQLGLINRFNLERAAPYFLSASALPYDKQKVAQK